MQFRLDDRLSRLYQLQFALGFVAFQSPRIAGKITSRSWKLWDELNLNFENGNCGDILRQHRLFICGNEDALIQKLVRGLESLAGPTSDS